MNKKELKFHFRWLILLGLILLSTSGCMLKSVEEDHDWLTSTVVSLVDMLCFFVLFFGLMGFFTALFYKKMEDRKSLLQMFPLMVLFPLVVYLIAFGGRFFSGEFYGSIFSLIIRFQRPGYSVLICIAFLLSFLACRRMVKTKKEQEKERQERRERGPSKSSYKKSKKSSTQNSHSIQITPKQDLFPDYYNSFDRLFNVLGYTHEDQEIKLSNGITFYQRAAREEAQQIPVFMNGEQQVLRQEMYYVILAAKSQAVAKRILQMLPCSFGQYQYVIVETPQGNWGRDMNGIYKED